ncbi:MAG: hypothetical protein EBS42_15210 [Caulobacteraceae bacterium]|nr:hypothetical protein [Caulobacteraceae bacterium]
MIIPWAVSRSPSDFYRLLCREGVTVLNQTPSAFQNLCTAQAQSQESHRLRYVIFGGEKLGMATLKPWFWQNPEGMTRLVNMYGITETTVHVTYQPLTAALVQSESASPRGRSPAAKRQEHAAGKHFAGAPRPHRPGGYEPLVEGALPAADAAKKPRRRFRGGGKSGGQANARG